MHRVDEELRAAGVGLAGVGHGEGSGFVGELGAVGVASELVGDVSAGIAGDHLAVGQGVAAARGGSTGTGTARVGVLRVGAAELVHEVGDDTVEVKAIVVSLEIKCQMMNG